MVIDRYSKKPFLGFDIEKENFMIVIDYDNECYKCQKGYMKNGKPETIDIPFDYLNRKSKKILLEKTKNLISNPVEYNRFLKYKKDRKGIERLNNLGLQVGSFEVLSGTGGTISDELKNELISFLQDEENVIGIHRVGSNMNEEILDDIMSNGLKMTGHQGSGVNTEVSLSQNISYYPDNMTILKELMYADEYKNSKGSLLIKIPKESLLNKEDIYIKDNNEIRLNPKYIVGYIPVLNHHIEEINYNQNYYEFNQKRY